jgi:hypothetical protein
MKRTEGSVWNAHFLLRPPHTPFFCFDMFLCWGFMVFFLFIFWTELLFQMPFIYLPLKCQFLAPIGCFLNFLQTLHSDIPHRFLCSCLDAVPSLCVGYLWCMQVICLNYSFCRLSMSKRLHSFWCLSSSNFCGYDLLLSG